MENKNNERAARRLSLIFVAVLVLVLGGILACIIATPYDSGVLMGASLSGNNQYGGLATASNDYFFYVQDGRIMRQNWEDGETQSIYEGRVSHLNAYDGWLYFVQDGRIMRTAYYGGSSTQIGTADRVTAMSVNGLWIYYLDEQGVLSKVRSDGKKQSALTDGSVRFTAFEAANRIILATDGTTVYRMKTDGTECTELVRGHHITRMVYTLDSLYYCDDGAVLQIKSVKAGQDDGTQYGGLQADIFTYDTDSNGRGQLFYVKGDELRVRKLQSVENAEEEDVLLVKADHVTDLYSSHGDLYYHDAAGKLYWVRISDGECKVEAIE